MRETRKIITVAAILALICGTLLSGASSMLKERIASNRRTELCRRILATILLKSEDPEKLFKETFSELIVFEANESKSFSSQKVLSNQFSEIRYALIPRDGSSTVVHLVGKGLWGEMRGFAALKQDLITLRGISFYQSNETPGLGAQFSDSVILERFKEKKINNSFRIIKKGEKSDEFSVDGISGATITGRAVEKILKEQIEFYRIHLKRRTN